MKIPLFWIAAALAAFVSVNLGAQPLAVTENLAQPESALWWPEARLWIVSNVNGAPDAADGNGFLSLVDPEGVLVAREALSELDGPKGLTWHEGRLWVTDITRVIEIEALPGDSTDPKARLLRRSHRDVPGARFLNDLASWPGQGLVVSDTRAQTLFLVGRNEIRTLAQGPALGNPNGLAVQNGRLYSAPFRGPGAPRGRVLSYALTTPFEASDSRFESPVLGALDGLVPLTEGWLVSDFNGGQVFRLNPAGEASLWLSGLGGPADLGWDPQAQVLAVPEMNRNRVSFYRFEP